MRISRPCYDKMHRCPGWAGGGMRSAEVTRCANGRVRRDDKLDSIYHGWLWRLRLNRCDTCRVVVLPYVVRWLDPAWLRYTLDRRRRERRYRRNAGD